MNNQSLFILFIIILLVIWLIFGQKREEHMDLQLRASTTMDPEGQSDPEGTTTSSTLAVDLTGGYSSGSIDIGTDEHPDQSTRQENQGQMDLQDLDTLVVDAYCNESFTDPDDITDCKNALLQMNASGMAGTVFTVPGVIGASSQDDQDSPYQSQPRDIMKAILYKNNPNKYQNTGTSSGSTTVATTTNSNKMVKLCGTGTPPTKCLMKLTKNDWSQMVDDININQVYNDFMNQYGNMKVSEYIDSVSRDIINETY